MLTWTKVLPAKGKKEDDLERWDGRLGSVHCALLTKLAAYTQPECWRVMVWLHWKDAKTLFGQSREDAMTLADAAIAGELEAMGLQRKPADG